MEEQERLFDNNLSAEAQVTKYKDFSVNFLAPLVTHPPKYDFIYIDGDHRGEVLFSDLCLAWQCLKQKGVMAIDGYIYDGVELTGGPGTQVAIDAFLKIHKSEIRLLEKSRQVIIQKRAVPLCDKEAS
jgi:predicted O-methyltransferase YrrM